MKKGTITKSIGFQILLYLLFGLGVLAGSLCLLHILWLWDYGAYYGDSFVEYERKVLKHEIERSDLLAYPLNRLYAYSDEENALQLMEAWSEEYNVGYVVATENGKAELFSSADSNLRNSPYFWDSTYTKNNDYLVTLYVDPNFPEYDMLHYAHVHSDFAWQYRYVMIWVAVGACLLAVVCGICILCNAGHRRGVEGILPGWLTKVPMEFLAGAWFIGMGVLGGALEPYAYRWDDRGSLIILPIFVTLTAVWSMLFLREIVLRLKLKCFWRTTLIGMILGFGKRVGQHVGKAFLATLQGLPMALPVMLGLTIFTLMEMLAIFRWGVHYGRGELFFLWLFEKIIITPVIIYAMLAFHKLQQGSRALASGRLTEKLNTDYLILDFKEHGENLNRIGEGMSKTVEERIRSERLKTELITNVSHDLKTPLTSVINYARLLGAEAAENGADADRNARIKEYSEVLLRQAERLKKLLDDLVDASKATTGNLDVNLEPCELGVLLTQAAGEYEEKFEAKGLKLKIAKPEEEVRIMADGRHLWRIFDNLLNNICKYAQENSRVYLNMEILEDTVHEADSVDGRDYRAGGKNVAVVFRNISKYELNVSPEELEERFVRGDSSRHMEGSGLGLSIAKSLAELQNGGLKIVTDGDLFKAILVFPFL